MPVILITAFPDEETLSEAARSGATALLSKPFDMDELRIVVHDIFPEPNRAELLNLPF